jgi:acetoin utilization deacetylase AcuC-like enzyme
VSDLPIVWTPEYEVDIGAHVFPTSKYRLVKERLAAEGLIDPSHLHRPRPASRSDLLRVHTPEWVDKVLEGGITVGDELRLELPFSSALRQASLMCCGGTIRTVALALEAGIGVHLGGGFHHAFAGHGEGFCLLNDVAVAVATARDRGVVDRAAVMDLDVHHGNGTAAIFRDEPAVFTFSMHQELNYPLVKPPSDLDVGLEDGTGDEEYLALLDRYLPAILEEHGPELVVYLAGADPYHQDQLGGLALTLEGLRRRDAMVLGECRARGVATAVVLAGGYARRLQDTVEIHTGTVREAARLAGSRP